MLVFSRRYPSTDRFVALIVQRFLQKFWLVSVAPAAQEHPAGQRHPAEQGHPAGQGHLAGQGLRQTKAIGFLAVLGAFGGSAASDSTAGRRQTHLF